MITTAQIRGARGILNWSQGDLSDKTDISATSIGSIENGLTQPRESTLAVIQKAFEDAGIEFLGLEGIRFRTSYVQNFSGVQGFSDFLDDVFQTAIIEGTKEKPTKIYLSNVVHENWIKWMGKDKWANHTKRMTEHKDVMDVRIIVKEGDNNFPAASYSQYKWFPEELFNDKSFYSYHDKLAFINFFEDDVQITVIQQSAFSEGYRTLFDIAWDKVAMMPKHKKTA
jgi:transcriptional regulator with XRE-family HTH domain